MMGVEKQHTATWAPDDNRPRKGPHKLARSSTRRRLFVELSEAICIETRPMLPGRLTLRSMADDPQSETMEPGQTYLTPFDVPLCDLRIYGPPGEVWGEVCAENFEWRELRCPTLEGR